MSLRGVLRRLAAPLSPARPATVRTEAEALAIGERAMRAAGVEGHLPTMSASLAVLDVQQQDGAISWLLGTATRDVHWTVRIDDRTGLAGVVECWNGWQAD